MEMLNLDDNELSQPQSRWKSFFEYIIETIKVIVVSLAIILPVRYYLIQPFYVKGASMEPTFHDHEYLIINEIKYRLEKPQRGEVVVFRYKKDPRQFFIKRVMGLPGEKVEINDGKIIIYNKDNPTGKLIDESLYLSAQIETTPDQITVLKDDEYFVMGDNRPFSMDSRAFGPIKQSSIIGQTWFRGWPFDRLGWIETPAYNL